MTINEYNLSDHAQEDLPPGHTCERCTDQPPVAGSTGATFKAQKKLIDFNKYCMENPEERFWQALRNWSEVDFIFTHKGSLDDVLVGELEDTFYKE